MRYFRAGSGPPIIVIPGVQGRWEWIRPALSHLSQRCTAISYSLCGEWGSGCRFDPARGFDNYLDQLDQLFERTGFERAAICGISYGGFVALRYAATRPARISSLIITSSPSPGWAPNPIQAAYIARPWMTTPKFVVTSPSRIWPEIRAAFDSPPSAVRFLIRHGLRVAAAPMIPARMAGRIVEQQAMDFAPDCMRVHAPTLIVTGEPPLDRIVPVDSTLRYLSMIPGSTHARIPRTGHLGLITRPDAFASVVGDFVHRHSGNQSHRSNTEEALGR